MVVSLYSAIVGAILLVFAGLVASGTVALVPGLFREFARSGRVLPYAYDAVTARKLAAQSTAIDYGSSREGEPGGRPSRPSFGVPLRGRLAVLHWPPSRACPLLPERNEIEKSTAPPQAA